MSSAEQPAGGGPGRGGSKLKKLWNTAKDLVQGRPQQPAQDHNLALRRQMNIVASRQLGDSSPYPNFQHPQRAQGGPSQSKTRTEVSPEQLKRAGVRGVGGTPLPEPPLPGAGGQSLALGGSKNVVGPRAQGDRGRDTRDARREAKLARITEEREAKLAQEAAKQKQQGGRGGR
jgi:hypothetical protein